MSDPSTLSDQSARAEARPKAGIVHLGIGAFYRAFALPWFEDIMAGSGGDWGVIGVSLRSSAVRDALAPQNFRYTCVEMGPNGRSTRVISALRDVLVAPQDPQAVLTQMANPDVHIITLTVTEKGYCHDPASGALNRAHPDIVHDLESMLPRSAPGFVLRALQIRRDAGVAAPTVISCDNLPGNGTLLRDIILDMAAQIDPSLRDWIAANAAFPETMVDRIVPATTPADIAALEAPDPGLVLHEPFRQWVIEDNFAGPHPDFAAQGVQLVQDVAPFEEMKLRMLNGSHSALAYLGYLAGHEHVSGAVADPDFARFLRHFWASEVIPTLQVPGVDLHQYAEDLLIRFSNPSLKHRLWQIAMDGSQKVPQRILGTLADQLAQDRAADGLLLTLAAWMRYVGAQDEAGKPIDVRDPLAERLQALSGAADTPVEKVAALLSVREVFAPELSTQISERLTQIYGELCADGAQALVERVAR